VKNVALAFASMILILPGWVVSSASPARAAASVSTALPDSGQSQFGDVLVHEFAVTIPAGVINGQGTPYTVPDGKLLIVEYISAAVFAEAGSVGGYAFLRSSKDAVIRDFFVVMTKAGNFGPDYMVAGQGVRLYFSAGTALYPDMGRSVFTSATVGASMTIVGRLVPA
jgi:hypothetical protein